MRKFLAGAAAAVIVLVVLFFWSQAAFCAPSESQLEAVTRGETIYLEGCLASPISLVRIDGHLYMKYADGQLRRLNTTK